MLQVVVLSQENQASIHIHAPVLLVMKVKNEKLISMNARQLHACTEVPVSMQFGNMSAAVLQVMAIQKEIRTVRSTLMSALASLVRMVESVPTMSTCIYVHVQPALKIAMRTKTAPSM